MSEHSMMTYAKAALVAVIVVYVANRTAMGIKYLGPKAIAPQA